MSRKFFPGCKVKARYPQASTWLAEQVLERGYADEVVGCCRVDHQKLTRDDTAVCICNNCMAMIDEDASNGALENIWALIDSDPDFPLPDYSGLRMGIQDCGRAHDRADVQQAVRSLMQKMGIKVVELADAGEKTRFCGPSFLGEVPEQERRFAPKRYVENAPRQGIFIGLSPEEEMQAIKAHCAGIEPERVCCYCFSCDKGLEAGGKDAVNILELVSGEFEGA